MEMNEERQLKENCKMKKKNTFGHLKINGKCIATNSIRFIS